MDKKTITIKSIGEVKLHKSGRAKNICLSIRPFQGLRVSVPKSVSYQYAEEIVNKKLPWIRKHLNRMRDLEQKCSITENGFKTRHRTLLIKKTSGKKIKTEITASKISIALPENLTQENPEVQKIIKREVLAILKLEAREYLPERLAQLAENFGFIYNKVFLKNVKSRWGSCSRLNNINLNIQLIRLPENLIDYVLLHELCHTKEKNHKAGFWTLMKLCVERPKALDLELKSYDYLLYSFY